MDSSRTSHDVTVAIVADRMQTLGALLDGEVVQRPWLVMTACTSARKVEFNSVRLAEYIRGKHRDVQEREAEIRPFGFALEDPEKYFAIMEAVGSMNISLGNKMDVQYSLWGGSVINLGTKRHKDKYFDGIDSLEYPDCFAMTELHHGSNVQGIQTTATFDLVNDEFINDTLNDEGGHAVYGKFATVFAKLLLPTQGVEGFSDMGVQAFIVQIREMKTHRTLPGVEINDCGFGDVSRDGKYTSPLPTVNKRFAATMGELVGGRFGQAARSQHPRLSVSTAQAHANSSIGLCIPLCNSGIGK
ncbi:hypothetical protein MLD38_003407 [Melastoma candidum]|uniref:Uncharacterized protein n=1 Tax=Melastoma candidum TaxID=119954 RepID=A0ACB9S5M2_9MYRT|nr:hypothetical protein MLD38_003407 [Melastoma candidum]